MYTCMYYICIHVYNIQNFELDCHKSFYSQGEILQKNFSRQLCVYFRCVKPLLVMMG